MFQETQAKLTTDFPSLEIRSIQKLGGGWDNEALLVNGKIVFRIPRQRSSHFAAEQAEHAKTEIKLLKYLSGRLPVSIPNIIFEATDGSYYGYQFIPGHQVSAAELVRTNTESEFVNLWVNSVVALEELLPLPKAQELGLAEFPQNEHRLTQVEKVIASKLLDDALRQVAQACLTTYAGLWSNSQQVSMHGDLGLGNWLYNPTANSYAIVDWSDACLAPPEFQMYRLIDNVPDQIDLVISRYEQISKRTVNRNLIYVCGVVSKLSIIGELLGKEPIADSRIQGLRGWVKLWVTKGGSLTTK